MKQFSELKSRKHLFMGYPQGKGGSILPFFACMCEGVYLWAGVYSLTGRACVSRNVYARKSVYHYDPGLTDKLPPLP